MKIASLIICIALSSCAGLTVSASLPWGDISTRDGETSIALRPIVIAEK